jgi:hypothetical protein
LADLINELSKTPDLDDEAMINFMGDQARLWRETNAEVRGVNDRKAIFLNWSHGLLVAAIASAVVSSLLQLWK